MNILFIIPEYYPHSGGGISTYYINYIKALKPYCKTIKVIVGSGYVQRDEVYTLDDIEIEYLKTDIYNQYLNKFSKFDLLPEFKRNIAAAWAMFEQAQQGKEFDIIECTEFGLGFIPWVIKHDKPLITRLHGSTGQIYLHETYKADNILIDFTRQTELLLLPLCDKLITYSSANQKFWNKIFNNESVVKIDPIFNTCVKQPLPLPSRLDYGLVTGRVQQWKGPIQLCQAVAQIKANDMPKINWIGRTMQHTDKLSMTGYLEKTFPAVWNKKINHQNPLPNEQVKTLQQQVKFGIVPSTWDMFNFTCLEFLAAGTPLICSDGAGASDLIEHGKNGLKYAAFDAQALADCIIQISRFDESEYNKLATAGLDTINSELSPDKLMPLNLNEYKAAIENFKNSTANLFLDTIYMPADKAYQIKDVLDMLPLKSLINYISKRAGSKLGKKNP